MAVVTSDIAGRTGSVPAGAARLPYEIRGSGPGLVFVPGGLVSSAHFAELAALLDMSTDPAPRQHTVSISDVAILRHKPAPGTMTGWAATDVLAYWFER